VTPRSIRFAVPTWRRPTRSRGHLRSGKATLYVADLGLTLAPGQALKKNLAEIGLDVEVRAPPPAYDATINTPGEPFDMAYFVTPPSTSTTRTHSSTSFREPLHRPHQLVEPAVDDLGPPPPLPRASRKRTAQHTDARRRPPSRHGTGGPLAYTSEPTLVSKRVSCVVLRPALDLAAACVEQ
jgi:hypothetical protein